MIKKIIYILLFIITFIVLFTINNKVFATTQLTSPYLDESVVNKDNFYIDEEGVHWCKNNNWIVYGDINTKDYKFFVFVSYGSFNSYSAWGQVLAYKTLPLKFVDTSGNNFGYAYVDYPNNVDYIRPVFGYPDASVGLYYEKSKFYRVNDVVDSYAHVCFGGTGGQYLYYLNFDLYDENGDLYYEIVDEDPNTYFNFKYNDLIYSIYGEYLVIKNYVAVFMSGNYGVLYTLDELPTYCYENYTHYMVTKSCPSVYIFNFATNTLELKSSADFLRENGSYYFPFSSEQLCYSNFSLYSYNNNGLINGSIFDNLSYQNGLSRDYDGNIGNLATGNLQASGSSGGSSFLDDYINSQDPDYNGSVSQGSATISGGFNNIYNKFGFAEDVKKNVNGMVDVIINTEEAPKFKVNVNSKYYKGTLTIVDLSWYEPYRELGDNVICIFVYLGFLWRIFCKLPDIIKGAGASSEAGNMISNIAMYSQYGVGRSRSSKTKL